MGEIAKSERDICVGGFRLHELGIETTGKPTYDECLAVGDMLARVNMASNWWIGDYILYTEGRNFGARADQLTAKFNKPFETLKQYARVCHEFPPQDRVAELTWTHHLRLCGLSPEDKAMFIEECMPLIEGGPPRMTAAELKAEVQGHRAAMKPKPDSKAEIHWRIDTARVISAGKKALADESLDALAMVAIRGDEVAIVTAGDDAKQRMLNEVLANFKDNLGVL